jgi:Tfp pilus assembly protein PilX
MRNWRTLLGNERGVALVLALMMLVTLTGLLLAFLSVSALEPQISRNLADTAKARYLAEAGIEVGYATLVSDPTKNDPVTQSFTPAINTATAGAPWVMLINNGTIADVTAGGAAAEATFAGTYTVEVRNNFDASDAPLATPPAADAGPGVDMDKIIIMRSTGTFNGANKTIEVVVRRANLPPFPGAVNLPGLQTDTFVNDSTFDIDGRDYACASGCDNAANWAQNASNPLKYGIATTQGTQSNKGISYEENIEDAVSGSSSKYNDIKGKSETNGAYTTGLNTIQGLDPNSSEALNPAKVAAYLDAVRGYAGTTILQSTPACRLVLTGNNDSSNPTHTPTLSGLTAGGSACGTSEPLDLGTRDNPKLVYFRGDLENPANPDSKFIGLEMTNNLRGAGVLVIEDGDLQQLGNFTWDGVVIVTGSYVGAGFRTGSTTTIRGAFVANEGQAGEQNGFFEFYMDSSTNFSVRSSKQNVDLVQMMRGNTTLTNWREL